MKAFSLFLFATAALSAQTYDLVIANGRVIDPETHLDAVRSLGIDGATIRAVSTKPPPRPQKPSTQKKI